MHAWLPLLRGVTYPASAVFLLSVLVLGLWYLGRQPEPRSLQAAEIARAARELDRSVDSLLELLGVPPKSILRQTQPVPGEEFSRTEKRVLLPEKLEPVQVHASLDSIAHRQGGRATASEIPKDSRLRVHLEAGGYILQTVDLKSPPPQKRQGSTP